MKKNQVKDLLKIVGVTTLTLILAGATFLGVNNLAFASATKSEQLAPITAPFSPDTKSEDNAIKAGYKKPSITVVLDPAGLDENGKPYYTPSADALSMEEAAQVGAQYIWDITGNRIEGMTVRMAYATWPSHSRAYWIGGVIVPGEVKKIPDRVDEHYVFTIDAVTGDRVNISPHVIDPHFEVYFTPDLLDEGKIVTMTPLQLEAMQFEAPPEVEEYAEIARKYARKHFNHSKVESIDFRYITVRAKEGQHSEAWNAGKDIPYPYTIYEKLRRIEFIVTDDTGREAILNIDMDTKLIMDIYSMDSDLIPGYTFN